MRTETQTNDVRSKSRQFSWNPAMQYAVAGLLVVSTITAYGRWQSGSWHCVVPYLLGSDVVIFPSSVDLGDISGKRIVEFDITATNLASEEIQLQGCQKSCGCLTVDEFPVMLQPAVSHKLRIKIGEPRKAEDFSHTLTFFTSSDRSPAIVVKVVGSTNGQ